MPTDLHQDSFQRSVLEFKSSTLTVPVLLLVETNIAAIETQLTIKISQAPEFFKNSPLIIDFNKISNKKLKFDLAEFLDVARRVNLQVIGIRGGNESLIQQAQQLNIAVLSEERKPSTNRQKTPKTEKIIQPVREPEQQQQTGNSAEIVTQPVRSGQQIYAAGDLIILAAVSAGAEIMAEGNIHVYGALRGRVLAGVKGNEACRIFCSELDAELISIAGTFQVSENIDPTNHGKPVQISLEKQKLIINEI